MNTSDVLNCQYRALYVYNKMGKKFIAIEFLKMLMRAIAIQPYGLDNKKSELKTSESCKELMVLNGISSTNDHFKLDGINQWLCLILFNVAV